MTPLASFEHMSIQLTVVVTESLYMLFLQFLSVILILPLGICSSV